MTGGETMRTGAVIVAAGMSKRMRQFKQLMKIGDMSFAERVVMNFKKAGVDDIVMVTGYQADQLEESLKGLDVVFLRNEQYETTQMFDSAKIGLSYMQGRVDRVFFCPVDIPFFLEETLRLELTRTEKIVLPICHNRLGHPILFDAELIPEILDYQGGNGLKGALDSIGSEATCYLPVADEGTTMDADTQTDLQYLIDIQNSTLMHPEVSVRLVNTKSFFDVQTVNLLKNVDSLGSVKEACEKIDISYSKGWNIIRKAEKALGYQLIERKAGGRDGGRSDTTKRCRDLIGMYELLKDKVSRDAEKEFCTIFSASELFPASTRERIRK